MSRKPVIEGEERRLTVILDFEVKNVIARIALSNEQTQSALVRQLIEDYVTALPSLPVGTHLPKRLAARRRK